MQEELNSGQLALLAPQVARDLLLPLVLRLFSVASIVSAYTEKLCQSLLCLLRRTFISCYSKSENIITNPWALAHITLCNFS